MNIKIRKLISLFLALCIAALGLTACKGKDSDTTLTLAPPNDTWQPAVDDNTDKASMSGRLTQDEIKAFIESALREIQGNNTATWDGDFSTLSDEVRKKAEEQIYADKGIHVDITKYGISYDKILPSQDEIIEIVNKVVVDKDKPWSGNFSELTEEQKDKLENDLKDKGYDVIVDDDGVHVIPSEPVSKTALSSVENQNLQSFGGKQNDRFMAVTSTSDGGYAALINTNSKDGDCAEVNQNWARTISGIVKYNVKGELEWKKFIGGNNDLTLSSIAELKDGSLVAVGMTSSTDIPGVEGDRTLNAIIVKYTATGEQSMIKLVKGSGGEFFKSVAATPDGGFVVGGKVDSSSDGDFTGLTADSIHAILFKYDKDGNVYWKRCINGGRKHAIFSGIAVNDKGEIYALCPTASSTNDFKSISGFGAIDTVVFKFDMNGQRLWLKSIVGSGNDEALSITCSPDGGCVVAGRYNSANTAGGTFASVHNYGQLDGFIIKYKTDGGMDWIQTLEGLNAEDLSGIAAVDGGYVLCGSSTSANMDFATAGNKGGRDSFVLLISETGKKLQLQTVAGKGEDVLLGVAAIDAATFVVVGGSQSPDGNYENLTPKGNENAYIATSAVYRTVKS